MNKNIIKTAIRRIIHFSGINALTRLSYTRYPRIIMFHKICSFESKESLCMSTDKFRRYLEYIKKHYYPMKICDLVNSKKHKGIYPKNAVSITFDDGFKSFYDFAWPLLQAFDIPATIFVVPDLIEKKSWVWPDQFSYLYDKGLMSFTDKTKEQLLCQLKKMSTAKREEYLINAVETSGIAMPKNIPEDCQLITWNLLKELSESRLIEIGSHTLTHPVIANENPNISWNEIYASRRILEDKLEQSVQSFCYPFGQIGDYRIDQIEMIRQAGYCCGVASHFGYVTPESNIMALPRIGGEHTDIYSFYKYLDGVEYILRKTSYSHCELCLQKDFGYRITKEYCIKKQCFNSK